MKRTVFLGLFAVILVFGFLGCDTGNGNETTTYTVTFDMGGGNIGGNTSSVKKTVAYGGAVSDLPLTQKEYYTFDGWYTEKNGAGTAFTSSTTVTNDLTVFANWTSYVGPKSITVKGLESYNGKYGFVGITLTGTWDYIALSNWDYMKLISSGEFTVDLWDYSSENNWELTAKWHGDGEYYFMLGIYENSDQNNSGTIYFERQTNEKIFVQPIENTITNINDFTWK